MIRQATISDFKEISHLRMRLALDVGRIMDIDYRIRIQRSGFLLPTGLEFGDFQEDILNYYVAEQRGRIEGYLRLSKKQDVPIGAKVFWIRPDLKRMYYSSPHAYIYGIGILPEAQHNGVATTMLNAVEQKEKASGAQWLFSMVVTSPVTNLASLLFHEKHAFQRIALVGPTHEHNMEGFQNILYGKQLALAKSAQPKK